MISAMPTVPASHFVPPVRGWPLGAAVLASVVLHSAAWFWIQPTRVAPLGSAHVAWRGGAVAQERALPGAAAAC